MIVVTSGRTRASEPGTRNGRLECTNERPTEVYQRCGRGQFTLKYTLLPPPTPDNLPDAESCIYVKPLSLTSHAESSPPTTPPSPPPPQDVSLAELEAMATRQHAQIVAQAQQLRTKQRRLRALRQQVEDGGVAAQAQRLRTLRERVAQQEQRLELLRAQAAELERNRAQNDALEASSASVRVRCASAADELGAATCRLDALSRLLQELRVERRAHLVSAVVMERDQLRRRLATGARELDARAHDVSTQRACVALREAVLRDVDSRIAQLQQRLVRRRALNEQRLSAAAAAAATGRNNSLDPTPATAATAATAYCQVAVQGKHCSKIQLLTRRPSAPAWPVRPAGNEPSRQAGSFKEPDAVKCAGREGGRQAGSSAGTKPGGSNAGRRAEDTGKRAEGGSDGQSFKARSHQKATSCTYLKPAAPPAECASAARPKGNVCSVLLSYGDRRDATLDDADARFYRRRGAPGDVGVGVATRRCTLSDDARRNLVVEIRNIRNSNNSLLARKC